MDVDASQETPLPYEEIFKNPPKGVYINKLLGNITIGTNLRHPSSIVLPIIVFGFILSFMGSMAYNLLILLLAEPPEFLEIVPILLFAIPTLFLFGCLLICVLLFIGGRVEVVIKEDGEGSFVFTGIGNIGKKKYFDWNKVKNIFKRTWKTKHKNGWRTHYEIIIEGDGKVNFGNILQGAYDKQFNYILAALKYYHEQK
ncbi:MAG: hypothetical protein FWC26_14590 [Fibromonadales bacterium]|nr:hypothetical protein [Fibromonadales bacterium]